MSAIGKSFASHDGEFHRSPSAFRDGISRKPGARFPPERGRYHLYVSHACPWAHRTVIVRALKHLEGVVSVSVVHYDMDELGWKFAGVDEDPDCTPDFVNEKSRLREVYFLADPQYSGRFTVPVLWDKKLNTIVNNESSEIIRMLNTEFDEFVPEFARRVSLYPEELQTEIDAVNAWIFDDVNNGVYKAGFATRQEIYERHCRAIFAALDRIESILARQEFLVDGWLTEADIRLFTTVLRFDPVYHGHFKCNVKSIEKDYPNILRWARRIYQMPEIAATVNMRHIKAHYYRSHASINPNRIVPLGNGPDLSRPIIELRGEDH